MEQIKKVIKSTVQEVSQDILAQMREDTEESKVIASIVADKPSFIENFYDIVEDSLDYDKIIQCVLQEIRNVVLSHK